VRFEWGEKKAAANLKKHKISFSEAVSVFYDRYLQPATTLAIPSTSSAT
jgi:uncharacterized DUF497 family protein